MNTFEKLNAELKPLSIDLNQNTSLSKYTTIGIGGIAQFLVTVYNNSQLEKVILLATLTNIPYIVIGKGSNVIFSDKGYQGLVIVNSSKYWKVVGKKNTPTSKSSIPARYISHASNVQNDSIWNEMDSNTQDIIVRVDSGVGITYLTRELFKNGITGLEWFAGIPSTVGGAIYMNMHGGKVYFGDLVESATILDGKKTKRVTKKYFQFDYDWTVLHRTKEIVLEADLRLKTGNVDEAKEIVKTWAKHKSIQPRKTAGCIFHNLSDKEQKQLNLPTPSVGYLIDKILKLKGTRIGNAIISDKHAAFIENLGNASEKDVLDLIELIKTEAKKKLDLDLIEEIQIIGKK